MGVSLPSLGLPEECDPRILEFASYWDGLRPDGEIPGRQHFDPVDVPSFLANIWLLEFHRESRRFRFRLVGTRVVDFLGVDPTGRWLDDAYPSFAGSEIEKDFLNCVKMGVPYWRKGPPFMEANKDYAQVERVALPLAADGKNADMILCLSLYER